MHRPVTFQCCSDLLAPVIYRAALNPAGWQDVVTALGRVFVGVRFLMVGTDAQHPSSVPQLHLGYSEDAARSYVGHYQYLNPWWQGWRDLQPGQVAHSLSVLSEAALLRTEFYADWLRPQEDLRHGVGTVLLRDRTRAYLLAGNFRGRDAARVGEQVTQALLWLSPLLRHALEVNRILLGERLDALAGRVGAPTDAPLVLLAPGSQVVYLNAAAEALATEGRVMSVRHPGRLVFFAGAANDHLQAAWTTTERLHLSFPVPGGVRAETPLRARLVPVSADLRAELQLGALDAPAGPLMLLALVRPPEVSDPVAQVQRALHLTRAEAEVALALTRGQVVKEIARSRRVSVETVRNQIKSVLHKTHSRRQADLVCLVSVLQSDPLSNARWSEA